MDEDTIRAALDRHWAASDANDFDVEHDIYREDAVLEYPQSGERIRGRQQHPGLARRAAERQALHGAPHRRRGRSLGHGIHPRLRRPAVLFGERHGVSWMARSPARPSTSPTRSSPDLRARSGSSEWDEIGATAAPPRVLERAELPVDTAELARFLIGKMLVRALAEGVAGGRIVETEAYDIGDPAGHAYRGMTPRNRPLFLERGHAYVYLAYGVSFMLNVSSESVRRRRGRLDQGDRANRWRRDHGAKSRHRAAARLGAGAGTAVRGLGDRSPAGRDRPLSDRSAVARI